MNATGQQHTKQPEIITDYLLRKQAKDDSDNISCLPNVDIPNIYECKQTLDLSAELESLFNPLFDEYFNEENQVVSKSFAVTTADASDKRQQQPDSTSSTSTQATTVTVDVNFDL
ncbi:hypothetical protein Tco_0660679 [Tanacetum coccineum]